MHLDPVLPVVAIVCLVVVSVGFMFRKLGVPSVIGYLISGVLVGPHVLGIITDQEMLGQLGAIGVVLLLFFVGMEVSPQRLMAIWKVAVGGTLLQIAISIACIWLVGAVLDWPLNRVILLGFVISLSSTAVALRMASGPSVPPRLSDRVTGILLVQDVAFVPMILTLSLLQGESMNPTQLVIQAIAGLACLTLFLWVARSTNLRLGLHRVLGQDRELQVFAALIVCFGLSMLTGLAGLSTALGAFLGGMLLSAARETHWIHESLESFRVVFVALFFLSIGMLLDVPFFIDRWGLVCALAGLVLLTNTFVNAGILRVFGTDWKESLHGGAFLAQVGELSYILAAIGRSSEIVEDFAYQVTVAMITITLIVSPPWTWLVTRVADRFVRTENRL